MKDIDDDLRIGVKSTAVTWRNKNPKLIMQQLAYGMIICHTILPFCDIDYGAAFPIMIASNIYLIKNIR